MAFKSLCLGVAIVCSIVFVNAIPRHHNIQKRSIKLCGSMLVDALATVCQNEYYDPAGRQLLTKKRNYAYVAENYPGYGDGSLTEFEGFVDPQTALDFLGQPRSTRGVADECCRKSCSFSQLLSYCNHSGFK
ncbi:bombyxin A-1 homolog [Parasteatoda tepidariorum]|uniref:bombyxin A-1 homolog n=1 Tax=Parasteatoda tepidariorum TaxID=114398 RepID=UPI001C71FD11|nr:bombyxin A-1 homolog [Parasteatoda tepidariorum]